MDLVFKPVSTLDWADVVDVFNAAYAGYVVPLSTTADALRDRCVAEDVSMHDSVVVGDGAATSASPSSPCADRAPASRRSASRRVGGAPA